MNFKKYFSFRNDNFLHIKIDNGIFIKIERISMSVARLYFINEENTELQAVPEGFFICDNSNKNTRIQKIIGKEEFYLCCTDDYSLFMKDKLILKLTNQRQWALHAEANVSVLSI